MCLDIGKNSGKELRKLRRAKTPITAYKVLRKPSVGGYISPWVHTPWRVPGYNRSDRKTVKLSGHERREAQIQKGFHFFTNLNDAIVTAVNHGQCIVVEVEILPRNLIAIGSFSIPPKGSIVAKSCSVKRICWDHND